mgnify:CR=1 FL=1
MFTNDFDNIYQESKKPKKVPLSKYIENQLKMCDKGDDYIEKWSNTLRQKESEFDPLKLAKEMKRCMYAFKIYMRKEFNDPDVIHDKIEDLEYDMKRLDIELSKEYHTRGSLKINLNLFRKALTKKRGILKEMKIYYDEGMLIQEGGYIRPTPSGTGYRHSAYDTSYDERKEFRKMARLYEGLIYLRREMRHMTKTQIMDRLAESYNYLAEIYDTIEDDYTEAPVRTSRLGFARRPRRTSTHRRDIDRLIYQIRREIIDLNGRAWNRTAVRGVIDQMLEVYEYEQRELGSIEHHGDRAVNAAVSHGARRLVERIMDQKIENVCDEIFQEEKLSTEDRKDLDDSQFGIPSLRKYPLTDKKHVLQAVRFFNKAPEEHKRELAKNIVKRAKELGMDWEKWESLKPYLDEKDKDEDQNHYHESVHTSKDFKRVKKTCEELVEHLDEFKYGIPRKDGKIHHVKSAKDYEQNYHSLTPDEFVKYGGGVCWDYVEYEEKWLKEHDIECRKFYIITETPPNYDTHTIVVVSFEGKHIWIESSFKKLAGVHVFDNLRDIFKVITYKMFDFNGNKHKWHQFKYSVMDFTNKHPDYGSTNDEYMDWMVSNARLIFDDVSKQDHPYTLEKNKIISESVDINDLKRQCGEIYNQGLQIKYGCLDENGDRIVASPFKDSWQMIVNYRSQSMESLQESKMGVCYEHSCYIAKLLKERNLPYQTFFLNVNIHVDSDHSLDCTFWHQFTIVPNDADSVVLIETSLTPEKNGVFLVANMDDAINHLIQSFDLNLSQEQIEAIERDLIDISSLEMKNEDTYLGYIQNVYRNGKLIEDNIRIKHRTEMMKLYWDYLNEHNYLSEDGKKIYEQIKEVDDDFRFEIQALSSIQELFTDEGNKFNEDFGIMDADVFFELTPSEMESKLKGFVQESFMGLKHNSLKADFNEIPLRPSTAKQYASQGVFNRNLGRIHLTSHTHGTIFTDENGVTVAYIAVEKKTDGNRWIVGMEVSQEFKHLKKEEDPYEGMDTLIGIKRPDEEEEGIVHAKTEEPIDFTIQLLQIAVDEYHANRMVITKNNLDNLFMLQENGWEVEKEEDGKIILALNDKSVSSKEDD